MKNKFRKFKQEQDPATGKFATENLSVDEVPKSNIESTTYNAICAFFKQKIASQTALEETAAHKKKVERKEEQKRSPEEKLRRRFKQHAEKTAENLRKTAEKRKKEEEQHKRNVEELKSGLNGKFLPLCFWKIQNVKHKLIVRKDYFPSSGYSGTCLINDMIVKVVEFSGFEAKISDPVTNKELGWCTYITGRTWYMKSIDTNFAYYNHVEETAKTMELGYYWIDGRRWQGLYGTSSISYNGVRFFEEALGEKALEEGDEVGSLEYCTMVKVVEVKENTVKILVLNGEQTGLEGWCRKTQYEVLYGSQFKKGSCHHHYLDLELMSNEDAYLAEDADVELQQEAEKEEFLKLCQEHKDGEFRVTGEKGDTIVIREGKRTDTEEIAVVVSAGDIVIVTEICGRRAKISRNGNEIGWCSLCSRYGNKFLEPYTSELEEATRRRSDALCEEPSDLPINNGRRRLIARLVRGVRN